MEGMDHFNLLQFADYSKKVLFVGDIKLNIDITGSYTKIAAEAPIPVFYESEINYNVTGAVTTARNLKALGIDTDIVAVVDARIQNTIEKEGIRSDHLIPIEGYIPETNTRYFADGVQVFHFSKLAIFQDKAGAKKEVMKKCEQLMTTNQYSAVVLIGDDECNLSNVLYESVIDNAISNDISTIVGCYTTRMENFKGVDVVLACTDGVSDNGGNIKMNKSEDLGVFKHTASKSDIKRALFVLSENRLISFDPTNGNIAFQPFQMTHKSQGFSMDRVQGGVLAAIGFCVSAQLSLEQTSSLAYTCGNYLVSKSSEDVVNITHILPNKVIRSKTELECFMKLMPRNKTIVATTGCFDLLHKGHVESLRKAKEFGDILIVLLNTDLSIKALKGPDRPISCLEVRLKMLLAVKHVDFVIVFDETVPYSQLEIIAPDVFVKGAEYSEEFIMKQFPFLKQFETVAPVVNTSTTLTIERLQSHDTY